MASTYESSNNAESTVEQPLVSTQTNTRIGSPVEREDAQPRASSVSRRGTGASSRRSFTLRRVRTTLLQPTKAVGKAPGFWRSLVAIIKASYLNILLVCIPVSWALHFAVAGKQDTIIFVFSFLAIIPLAKLLAFATDDISIRVGQTLAGLLNATLGNAVELIVSIIALAQCKLKIVQSSLVGSILSNLLLVLGMCFFAGGTKFSEQGFGIAATQLNSSLLTISVIAVLLPQAFHVALTSTDSNPDPDANNDILQLSHGVAIILLFIYGSYLVFQLWSHATLYDDNEQNVVKSTRYAPKASKTDNTEMGSLPPDAETVCPSPDLEEEQETPQMSLLLALVLLAVVTVLVAVTAEFLVSSIDGLVEGGGISEEFVGIILLPIVGNAAEHVTAVTVSVKDKLTLSLGVAAGSSIQIALFVIPFIVTLAWIMGKPLTLLFDPYESISLFLAVLTVNYVVQDGKSNWLEGMILMCLYVILAVTFWYYPGSNPLIACT